MRKRQGRKKEMGSVDFSGYASVFSWRYASDQMRELWSEEGKRLLLRKVWSSLAQAQNVFGLVSDEELADIKAHEGDVDIPASLEAEKEIGHDLMAEIKVYSAQCPVGGGKIHLGATSADILDNADAIRLKRSLSLIRERMRPVLAALSEIIAAHASTPVMAWTHLQSAECITIGYRFALYAEELLAVFHEIRDFRVLGKGLKGACGNASSYETLLGLDGAKRLERMVMESLGLEAFPVTGQTYPRRQDYRILSLLSELSLVCAKFAMDMRVLQSSGFGGEVREAFSRTQVGSSAMPFKRNPVTLEKISSLCRIVPALAQVAWENGANSILERTLDDSANRRIILSEAFLCADEILLSLAKVLLSLEIDTRAVKGNLDKFAAYSGTEVLIMEACKRGADRQRMHEEIRRESMRSYEETGGADGKRLMELLASNAFILKYLDGMDIIKSVSSHSSLGFSRERALETRERVERALAETGK